MLRAALLILLLASTQALAMEDTPANRLVQAERYVRAINFKALVAAQLEGTDPENRAHVERMITKFGEAKFETILVGAAVQTFTADELSAAADYYGSPLGQSLVSKVPAFMAIAIPTIRQEMQ